MQIDPYTALAPAAGVPHRLLLASADPAGLDDLSTALEGRYAVQRALSGAQALRLARHQPPDLLLLDAALPDIGGFEVCRRLKADPASAGVPVLLLLDPARPDDEGRSWDAGAADHLQRSGSVATALARVATQLQLRDWQRAQQDRAAWLQAALDTRLHEVDELRDATLFVMVSFAEFRDEESGHHVRRTQEYVRTLACWLQGLGDARYALSPQEIGRIATAAPLHDIGKAAIPDGILLKPARLTAEEFTIMKTHALRGWELLSRAAQRMGDEGRRYLRHAMDIARHHHERWDGTGYPDGLAGQAIPLSARLMAVADVYDALVSRRPYKGPMDPDEALRLIGSESGHHFDPVVVMAMQATVGQIAEIAARWQD